MAHRPCNNSRLMRRNTYNTVFHRYFRLFFIRENFKLVLGLIFFYIFKNNFVIFKSVHKFLKYIHECKNTINISKFQILLKKSYVWKIYVNFIMFKNYKNIGKFQNMIPNLKYSRNIKMLTSLKSTWFLKIK